MEASRSPTLDEPVPDPTHSLHPEADFTPSYNEPPEPMETSRQYHSKVNGLGMWSAWERNFSNKFKACLDLVDNAVDAALWDSDDEEEDEEPNENTEKAPLTVRERWEKQSGSIHISTEKHRLAMECYDSDDETDVDVVDVHVDGDVGIRSNQSGGNSDGRSSSLIGHDLLAPNRKRGGNGETTNFQLIDDENTLCLHNDCVRPVKELRKILDVYNSDKADSAIGENGVGVKQAAAAMSELSIVVTTRVDEEPLLMDYGNLEIDENSIQRYRKVLVSVGVLAKKMQSKESCVIPSWTLPIEFDIDEVPFSSHGAIAGNDGEDNDDEALDESVMGNSCKAVLIRALSEITITNNLFMKTMREFGGAADKNRRKYGIQRLAKHIELMVSSKKNKPPHPHQYLMILHKFGKHKKVDSDGETDGAKARNDLDDLLRDLAEEMPKTYLHIPPAPYFKVRVNQKVLKFQYWERNLVALHQIPLFIDWKNDFRTADDWTFPENDDYQIKVSIGFDPKRANPQGSRNTATNSFIGGQACSLLIFSRLSGRLFLKHDDARGVLRLSNSGTSFCQGLTIIVDDFEGHLPLTPTKESLAFGMEAYGKNHERNLYAWLGALANFYWNHFHSMFKTKRQLGEAVKSKLESLKELDQKPAVNLPTLRFGTFSTFINVGFSRNTGNDSIRPYKTDSTEWTNGPSTLVPLSPRLPKSTQRPKAATSTTKKRKATDLSALDSYGWDRSDLVDAKLHSPASEDRNILKVPDLPERLDGRPRRATREPDRFKEMPEIPRNKKKRSNVKGSEATLRKTIKELESVLSETQVELNASKSTCDDLQLQLEEIEEAGEKKVNDLNQKINEMEARHKEELRRVKEEFAEQLRKSRRRILELEGKESSGLIT